MNDLETVIFDALYREGFSKAGSSGKHTEHLAKSVARDLAARAMNGDFDGTLEESAAWWKREGKDALASDILDKRRR